MFADYRVPQSLQYFGAFKYSDKLLNELHMPEVVMDNGSQFEKESRGVRHHNHSQRQTREFFKQKIG